MSAYIVSHDHIDGLLSFALDQVSYYVPTIDRRIEITLDNAEEIGRILLTENERSVYFRYRDLNASKPGLSKPGTDGQDAENYSFRPWPLSRRPQPIEILKACECFDYQACETDDYEQSIAWRIIDAIRHGAIRKLPGYENADGWELRRPTSKVTHKVGGGR
jgi:hypothetical protein